MCVCAVLYYTCTRVLRTGQEAVGAGQEHGSGAQVHCRLANQKKELPQLFWKIPRSALAKNTLLILPWPQLQCRCSPLDLRVHICCMGSAASAKMLTGACHGLTFLDGPSSHSESLTPSVLSWKFEVSSGGQRRFWFNKRHVTRCDMVNSGSRRSTSQCPPICWETEAWFTGVGPLALKLRALRRTKVCFGHQELLLRIVLHGSKQVVNYSQFMRIHEPLFRGHVAHWAWSAARLIRQQCLPSFIVSMNWRCKITVDLMTRTIEKTCQSPHVWVWQSEFGRISVQITEMQLKVKHQYCGWDKAEM